MSPPEEPGTCQLELAGLEQPRGESLPPKVDATPDGNPTWTGYDPSVLEALFEL
jgi:hypothetical protein